ncbi:MAG: AAA family ATPase [Actinomycetota bacterium]
MSRLSRATPAVRPALKARLMISGPAGGGKTWTALSIAEVLTEHGRILVIDTEKESALTYADNFTFDHLPWHPPFDPRELAATVMEAGETYDCVIVDSASHFWTGSGGTLDIAEGRFTGWKAARPAQADLVDAILQAKSHVIICARSKMEHVQETDPATGRQVVRKLGMAPQQDNTLEYELNLAVELDLDHRMIVSKSRTVAVPVGQQYTAGHEKDLAVAYQAWLASGEPPLAGQAVDALKARLAALSEHQRAWAREEWQREGLPRPEFLRESQMGAVEAVLAAAEARGAGQQERSA